MSVRLLLAGALVAALAAPAAASAAPTLGALKPCYVSLMPGQTEPVQIAATGFMPFAAVDVFVDDLPQTTATADALGDVKGSFPAPYIVSGQRWFTVRLSEKNTPATAAAGRSKVTALSVTQSPVKAPTGSKVRFRGRGFTDRTLPVYAHYLFHAKVERTVLIGKPFGDCGQFSVRRRQFPISRPRTGTWVIQFDQGPHYSPQTSPFTQIKIVVTQKLRLH
jgi:hypothetical protein